MGASVVLALLGVGLAVGFVSGLVGIGGGVLMVPFLYFFYGHPGWSSVGVPGELEAAVAHATSLFIILPTALRGVLVYHRSGLVAWRAALPLAVGAALAAVGGARLALGLPPELLKLAFGVLLLASAVRLVKPGEDAGPEARRLPWAGLLAAGAVVGLLSALLGVGGGIVAIPILIHLVGLELRKVAATSLVIIVFAAVSGTLTYVVSGLGRTGLPPGSLGYVHVLAAVPMLAGSLLAVRAGVRTNERMGDRKLRLLFAGLFALLGVRLVLANLAAL